MTRGMTLGGWDTLGMLYREIKPYQKLTESFSEICIFTYGDSSDLVYSSLFPKNIKIITRLSFLPMFIYSFLLPFIHRAKLKNTQILKTNQMDGSWAAVIAKKLYKNKLVVRCGYEWLQTLEKAKKSYLKRMFAIWAEKFAYSNADKIIFTSEDSKNFAVNKFKIELEKISIIPNYIDTDLFKPLNINKENGRIIFVGRLEQEKNLINLFMALAGLNAKLVVVGRGSQEGELKQLAQGKNLKVEFKGSIAQSELPSELNKSEIFILPSVYEGNPKALLEAMASGVACIGSNIPGIDYIIAGHKDGILCNTDVASIREAISLLLGNRELRVKLGASARRKIEAQNSFSVILNKEIEVYDQILR